MSDVPVLTIGYGAATVVSTLDRIQAAGGTCVADIRSRPASQARPEFNRWELRREVQARGMEYVFLGEELGGRPSDPSCYTEGRADYTLIAAKDFFHRGIERLLAGRAKGFTICLLCSEAKPEMCHRSKLLGRELTQLGIEVVHIRPDGTTSTQGEVMDLVTGGQQAMLLSGGYNPATMSRGVFDGSGSKR